MRICINVNVFLINILLSSTVNMALKILYFGRMEGGDWYYAVICFVLIYFNWLSSILENGGWTLELHSCFLINIFNGFSSILNFYNYNISLF